MYVYLAQEGSFLEIYNEAIRDLLVSDKEVEGKQVRVLFCQQLNLRMCIHYSEVLCCDYVSDFFLVSPHPPHVGTGTWPDCLVNSVLTKNEGPHPKKICTEIEK